jgi:hypothetical protein
MGEPRRSGEIAGVHQAYRGVVGPCYSWQAGPLTLDSVEYTV